MSLNNKFESKSMSMKDLYMYKDALLGESGNLNLPTDLKVPACSLEPVAELDNCLLQTPKNNKPSSYLNISDQLN